ncbi:hypothetical protein FD644_05220 [Serratia fonticola]|uniref:hypothetical protein n=1 Tax=Serratia fonticola TaxID=47917 RepID=UPI0009C0A784|nr:hypothetical protein [Serratia fonticola]PAA97408.1 hypothetical protein CJJ13_11205 [Serratia fonticola]QCR59788.1 hypothetical protein FD644_05220 [Serratia fonticola]
MANPLICAARKAVAAAVLGTFPWGMAQALIDIRPKIVEIKGEEAVVNVINTGDKSEFVEVGLFELVNPGVPPEQEQRIPLGIIKTPYLYAAPFKLSLGPRQEKRVHLKPLQQPEQEKVYRLSVIPQQKLNISGTRGNVMVVNLGYMGLVRQLPMNPIATWQHRCEAQGLQLAATGTVRVEFSELTLDGKAVDSFNVYPGTPRHMAGKTLRGKAQDKTFTLQCGA